MALTTPYTQDEAHLINAARDVWDEDRCKGYRLIADELTWRIDPRDFEGVTFARDNEGMAKPQLHEGQQRLLGGGQRFQLLADIDVVTIAATGLRDLAQLGAIIQERRQRISQEPH